MMFNAGVIDRVITRRHPANIIFCRTEDLCRIAETSDDYSAEVRARCAAELFVRYFLQPKSVPAESLDRMLPDGERAELPRRLPRDLLNCPTPEIFLEPLWVARNEFSRQCEIETRERLRVLCCETDGFIPVFCGGEAFFIPFHFLPGEAVICDSSGTPIEGWQAAYTALSADWSSPYRCEVYCDCSQPDLPELTGPSLMLPLYLAYLRKTGKLRFDHLRLLATGTLENGNLKAVKTDEKAAALSTHFDGAYLFFPESPEYFPKTGSEIALRSRTQEMLREELPRIIEAKGLVVLRFRDALTRLQVLVRDRDRTVGQWKAMLDRLETIRQAIPESRSPENHLLCCMLESSIRCHMGDTARALTLNRQAQNLARAHGFEKQLRRMEIEELIELQDQEDFETVLRLNGALRENIEKLADPDLKMRYYGTIGQAHCYGVLAKKSGFDREYARRCFDLALQNAYEVKGEDGESSEDDIAKDLNYRFLWYALFAPETPGAEQAYREAVDHIRCNLSGGGREKNRRFLSRIKAFAVYRHWLATGELPTADPAQYLLPPDAHWLAAVSGKYVGALKAAAGESAEAQRIFGDALEILRRETDPILRFIQMTILAEAYRSTGETAYRDEAVALLALLKEPYPGSVGQWEGFLRGENPFPGLDYWY